MNTNMIGPLGTLQSRQVTKNQNGQLNIPKRDVGAVFYDKNSVPQGQLIIDAISKIVNSK